MSVYLLRMGISKVAPASRATPPAAASSLCSEQAFVEELSDEARDLGLDLVTSGGVVSGKEVEGLVDGVIGGEEMPDGATGAEGAVVGAGVEVDDDGFAVNRLGDDVWAVDFESGCQVRRRFRAHEVNSSIETSGWDNERRYLRRAP